MGTIIKVEHLIKRYETYKRGSGFKESVKSFFHRMKTPVRRGLPLLVFYDKGGFE